MKQVHKWRQFLYEERMGPYQIYCDMDGVLVDFVKGALEQMNRDVQDATLDDKEPSGRYNALGKLKLTMERAGIETLEEKHIEKNSDGPRELRKVAIKYMYERLWDDEEFWANLSWMPGGRSLWETIRSYNPYILTAPMGEGSERGKQRWIDKNLNPQPSKIFMSHDKYNWARDGDQKNVLIDDFVSNIKPWRKKGGIAIHHDHEDIQQTLTSLSELGFKTKPIPNEHAEDNSAEEKEESLPLLENRRAHSRLTIGPGGNKRLRRRNPQKK